MPSPRPGQPWAHHQLFLHGQDAAGEVRGVVAVGVLVGWGWGWGWGGFEGCRRPRPATETRRPRTNKQATKHTHLLPPQDRAGRRGDGGGRSQHRAPPGQGAPRGQFLGIRYVVDMGSGHLIDPFARVTNWMTRLQGGSPGVTAAGRPAALAGRGRCPCNGLSRVGPTPPPSPPHTHTRTAAGGQGRQRGLYLRGRGAGGLRRPHRGQQD